MSPWCPCGRIMVISNIVTLEIIMGPVPSDYYNLLTENQAALLTAIACQGSVSAPTSLEFIMRYRLPAPSSIKLALQSLQDKEFLFQSPQGSYLVYDRFFGIWLKRLASTTG